MFKKGDIVIWDSDHEIPEIIYLLTAKSTYARYMDQTLSKISVVDERHEDSRRFYTLVCSSFQRRK